MSPENRHLEQSSSELIVDRFFSNAAIVFAATWFRFEFDFDCRICRPVSDAKISMRIDGLKLNTIKFQIPWKLEGKL